MSKNKKFLVGLDLTDNQIKNVAAPTQSGDVATFEWVTGLITDEQSARELADSTIDGKISDIISNTDVTKIDSFSEVVETINSEISSEEARAIAAEAVEAARAMAAEATLTSNLNAEEAARIADVDNEETRATGAEATLTSNLNAEVSARVADVDAEESRAMDAES